MKHLLMCAAIIMLLVGTPAFADFSDDFEDGDMVGWASAPGYGGTWEISNAGIGGNSTKYLWQSYGGLSTHSLGGGVTTLGALLLVDDGGYSNFDLSTKMYLDASGGSYDDMAVVFGYQDAMNYYYVSFNEYSGETVLYFVTNKHSAAPETQGYRYVVATSTATFTNTWYDIEVTRAGNIVNVTADGNAIFTNVDLSAGYTGTKPENAGETYVLGAGQVGVGSYNDAVGVDDFSVVPEPATMTLLGLGAMGVLLRRRR